MNNTGPITGGTTSAISPETTTPSIKQVVTIAEGARAINLNPTVTKSNNLVRSLSALSKNEQKLLAVAISKLNPMTALEENNPRRYRVELGRNEIAEALRIPIQNVLPFIKRAAYNFHATPIQTPGTENTQKISYINIAHKSEYDREKDRFFIEFHDEIVPELMDMKENFTSYRLSYQVVLSSKHALRLYEIFKSAGGANYYTFILWDEDRLNESLYFMLGLRSWDEKKDQWKSLTSIRDVSMFRRRVLSPALEEINRVTDLCVTEHDCVRRGRSVYAIRFKIEDRARNQVLLQKVAKLTCSKNSATYLIAKYGDDCVKRNADLMEANMATGSAIKNPPAYLTRLCRYDMAGLPEKVSPVSDENRINKNARLFLDRVVLPIWSGLSSAARDMLGQHGLDHPVLGPEFRLYTSVLKNEGLREANSLVDKRSLRDELNKFAEKG